LTSTPVRVASQPPVQTVAPSPVQTVSQPSIRVGAPVQTVSQLPVRVGAPSPIQTVSQPPVRITSQPPVQTVNQPLQSTKLSDQTAPVHTSKLIYIIILVVTFLIIAGFLGYLIFAHSKRSGPFVQTQPQLGSGLIFFNATANPKVRPPNPTDAQKAAMAAVKTKAQAQLDAANAAQKAGDSEALVKLFFGDLSDYKTENATALGGGRYQWPNAPGSAVPCADLAAANSTPCS